MISDKIIDLNNLNYTGSGGTFSGKVEALLETQKKNWELPKNNYDDLKNVKIRRFDFDGFHIKVQFNPGRIVSTSAKVDKKTIDNRKCFLCSENLPEPQKALREGEYLILCNPYPIFPQHFTIPKIKHEPQRIEKNFKDLLHFAQLLGEKYSVFYNGPACGASAPDHMHFQAGSRFFMPIDSEFADLNKQLKVLPTSQNTFTSYTENYLRGFISFESGDTNSLIKIFSQFYNSYSSIIEKEIEPMMNIIASYEKNKFRVIIFPRAKHRPSYYFFNDKRRLLISPAAVDLGGVLITPREEDYLKISKEIIADIFGQVTLGKNKFRELLKLFREKLERD